MTRRIGYWVLLLMLFVGQNVTAQDAIRGNFVADKTLPLIGEPVQLTLVVEVPHQSIVQMPQIAGNWLPFTVIEISPTSTRTHDSMDVHQQTLSIVFWQAGDFSTPETIVDYQLPGSQKVAQLIVEPAFFTVPSTLTDTDKVLRPLKSPIMISFVPVWAIVIVAIALVASGFWLARFLNLRRLTGNRLAKQKSTLHIAAQQAVSQLKHIVNQSNKPVTIYSQTVDCLRTYLYGRFKVDAADMTTLEILAALKAQQDNSRQEWDELQRLLERGDLVKFARVEPQLESAKQFAGLASQWIGRLERTIDQKNP